ncbi:MAG: endonuclease/exonuclease/phosphatase family protein [Planctomycetes bacterium]|nr:endonuclease/exonuclease/phosphatase family protein [Planctomycetota bacterium]
MQQLSLSPLLLCLGVLGVLAVHPSFSFSDQPLDLKVLTFNIRYGTAKDGEDRWERRRQQVFDLLRRQSPDLAGLQEALRFQIDEIRAALPEYGEVGAGRDDGGAKGEHATILYRRDRFDLAEGGTFWLSDTPEAPGSASWGNKTTRISTWGRFVEKSSGQGIYLYNVHLDHESQPAREKGCELVALRMRGRWRLEPALLTGDFNAGERNAAIRYLKGEGTPAGEASGAPPLLIDSFRALHPNEEEAGTFHAFKGGRQGEKIDHIFVPPWVGVLEAAILHDQKDGRYPSDHFPVMARLQIPVTRES